MIEELAEFEQESVEVTIQKVREGTARYIQEWRALSPSTDQQILEFYRKSRYSIYDLVSWHVTTYRDYVDPLLSFVCSRDAVLDYGCGIGTLSILMAKKGATVISADLPSHNLDFAIWRAKRARLPIKFRAQAGRWHFKKGAFDIVISIDVLEHLIDPLHVTARLIDCLPAEGLFLYRAGWGSQQKYPMHLHENQFSGYTFEQFLESHNLLELQEGVWHKCSSSTCTRVISHVKNRIKNLQTELDFKNRKLQQISRSRAYRVYKLFKRPQ